MQSAWHNLPLINGRQQLPGRERTAAEAACACDEAQVRFQLELANAYDPDAGVESWVREFVFARGQGVRVTDRYRLQAPPADLTLCLMTASTAVADGGCVRLQPCQLGIDEPSARGVVTFDPDVLTPAFDTVELDDERLRSIWGATVTRIRLQAQSPPAAGELSVGVTAAGA